MVKKSFLFLSVIFIMTLSSCSAVLVKENQSFIKVSGSSFTLGGKPVYVCGTNFWYGPYLGSKGKTGDRERLLRELDNLKALGITNLRIMGACEDIPSKETMQPAIQAKPGVYDEELLDGLDFLLAEMGKRDMHAVIFMNNYWDWTGGMGQYLDWVNGGGPKDPKNNSMLFYSNDKANELFKSTLKNLITRKNSYTGKNYYDDPAIMSWQLANEPRPDYGQGDYKNGVYLVKWADETAKYIHSLDPNHLVSTGSEGLMGSLESEGIYLDEHRSQYIDYMTMHLWPLNWSWYDPKKPETTYPVTVSKAAAYINTHIGYARMLNKPLVMEEFGIPRDGGNFQDTVKTTYRDQYYKTLFTLLYDSAAAGSPMAGFNFWAWGGEARAQHSDGWWKRGDTFTGDPAGEQQGLNSVFSTDTTTLSIIKETAGKFKELSERTLTKK